MEERKFSRYDDSCSEVAFLLGGIGTGNISLGARGELKDFEIFGTSGKGNYMPNGFFAVYAKTQEMEQPFCRVLESRLHPPFSRPRGFLDYECAGLPRFAHAKSQARYPFFQVDFSEEGSPISASLEAFTPFIPLNARDSGIPGAILRYRIANRTNQAMQVSVAGSLSNLSSLKRYEKHTWQQYTCADEGINEYREENGVRGLFFRPKSLTEKGLYYGSLALTTRQQSVTCKRAWLNGGWWDGLQDMWDDFTSDGKLEKEPSYTQKDAPASFPDCTGSLAIHQELQPGEEKVFEFAISWCYPNRVNCWSKIMYDSCLRPQKQGQSPTSSLITDGSGTVQKVDESEEENDGYPVVQKYYANFYQNAWQVSLDLLGRLKELEGYSRRFADALYSTTLPVSVIEAVADNLTVIRSNTCFRLADGTFMAWEGCFEDEGCCEGSCTHVWNYAQTLAYLFPELEQSMRRVEYLVETQEDGKMNFRTYQLFGMGPHDHVPAADGQMGTLIRLYREWKISGDDAFLKELWPKAKKTLDFAFRYWDTDGDFVLDHNQFNTYDIAFQGPSSMVNSLFYGALLAGAEISEYLGDEKSAAFYREAFEKGSKKMDALLWNGEYYVQKTENVDEYRYQYGEGCLSDQIFGQTMAHLAGLGYVLPREHVKKAVKAIFDRNYIRDFTTHTNPQRVYVLNQEQGLVLCTWEEGGRPRFPFPYSDEVWTGIEYQVATNLIYEGFLQEALTIVENIRRRQDGVARNPFNEAECGYHYARSLASYGVYVALCGYTCDLPHGKFGFAPRLSQEDFSCFYCNGREWGIYTQKADDSGEIVKTVTPIYQPLAPSNG